LLKYLKLQTIRLTHLNQTFLKMQMIHLNPKYRLLRNFLKTLINLMNQLYLKLLKNQLIPKNH